MPPDPLFPVQCRRVAGVYVDADIDGDIPDGRPWDPVWLAPASAVAPSEPADDGSKRPGDPVAQRPPTYLQIGSPSAAVPPAARGPARRPCPWSARRDRGA